MFKYPDRIINDVRKAWKSMKRGDPELSALPPGPVLRRLLEVAYHASFMTEEGRKPGFRIAYCPKLKMQNEYGSRDGLGSILPIEFPQCREFTPAEIVGLAPAVDYRRALICVHRAEARERSDNESLHIWGLIDSGSSWWHRTRGGADLAYSPPNVFTVSSTDVGNITVCIGGHVLLRLQHGQVSEPATQPLSEGPLAEIFRTATDEMYETEVTELKSADRERDQPKVFYKPYLTRILHHVAEASHGAALLVVRDPMGSHEQKLAEGLHTKYPCLYDRAWRLLIDKAVQEVKYSRLEWRLFEGGEMTKEDIHELVHLGYLMKHIDRLLSDSAEFVASLSAVDGAIVLTDRFRVLGFGAEVRVGSRLERVKRVSDNLGKSGEYVRLESFGTRHRSAFRFCWRRKNAVAFIVSQDGGVKAAKRVGPDLLLWPDIEFGSLGL